MMAISEFDKALFRMQQQEKINNAAISAASMIANGEKIVILSPNRSGHKTFKRLVHKYVKVFEGTKK